MLRELLALWAGTDVFVMIIVPIAYLFHETMWSLGVSWWYNIWESIKAGLIVAIAFDILITGFVASQFMFNYVFSIIQ